MERGSEYRLKRLFVGIAMPDHIRSSLVNLHKTFPGFRWNDWNQMHITLKFIGDVNREVEDAIVQTLEGVRVEPFYLAVNGLGCFPNRDRPAILWAGLGSAHPRLFQLKKKLDDALLHIGVEPEKRPFHPHITLARCKEAAAGAVHQFVKNRRDFGTAPFKVTGIHLYSSKLNPTGSEYTQEAYWSFD